MIAYAPATMSIGDWFRRLFPSPTESAEEEAALHEEYGVPDAGEADVSRMQYRLGGGPVPGIASSDAAEVAEAELEELDHRSDPAP